MANPRKFSEKIALHHQKQAEEKEAFEKIMLEVSKATKEKPVNNVSEEIVPNQNQQARGRAVSPAGRQRGGSFGSVGPIRPVKRPADKPTGPYLPIPSDTSWRRTNSDSALHQSIVSQANSTESLAHLHSPGSQRRTLIDNQQYDENRLSTSPDKRPRSCCDVPRVPGINVFTTQQEPGVVQIPIGNNTGSLPDLTNLLTQFSQPIHVPLDQDDPYNLQSPFNSNSPLTDGCSPQSSQGSKGTPSQSPSLLSPVSINSRTPPTRFSFTSSPPPDSPNQTTVITCEIVLPNYLNVPYLTSDRSQHKCEGFNVNNSPGNGNLGENCNSSIEMRMLEQNSNMNCGTGQINNLNMNQTLILQTIPLSTAQQTQQPCSVHGQTEINSSHLNIGNSQLNNLNSIESYRNQHSNRPSPQSSPGLAIQFGSSSPSCNSPQSPSSPSNSSVSSNLHKRFEDFSMNDSPKSGVMDYIGSPINHPYLTQTNDDVHRKINTELDYPNTPPLQSVQYPNQNHTTPINTAKIPHIILTDFSYPEHELNNRNDYVKDLNSTTFDANFYPIDDNMRQGFVDQIHLDRLDPLDQLDYLQMYPDSNIDAVTNNDHF